MKPLLFVFFLTVQCLGVTSPISEIRTIGYEDIPVSEATEIKTITFNYSLKPIINEAEGGNSIQDCSTISCSGRKRRKRTTDKALAIALRKLTWLKDKLIYDRFIRLPSQPQNRSSSESLFELASWKENKAHKSCITYDLKKGHCRHLQYCILPYFELDYNKFLENTCYIGNQFVGTCCPDTHPIVQSSVRMANYPQERILNELECGRTSHKDNPHPWTVTVNTRNQERIEFRCGGALITNRHVLTSAHCIHRDSVQEVNVAVGLFTMKTGQNFQDIYEVEKIHMHEAYYSAGFENNIGVVTLSSAISFSDYIRPVCLPPPDQSFRNQNATAVAWHRTRKGYVYRIPTQTSLRVWADKECTKFLGGNSVLKEILCVGDRRSDECEIQDDSGDLLLIRHGKQQRWTLIGINSLWVSECQSLNNPEIFARVSHFLDWIRRNMN